MKFSGRRQSINNVSFKWRVSYYIGHAFGLRSRRNARSILDVNFDGAGSWGRTFVKRIFLRFRMGIKNQSE